MVANITKFAEIDFHKNQRIMQIYKNTNKQKATFFKESHQFFHKNQYPQLYFPVEQSAKKLIQQRNERENSTSTFKL